jgi:hypothetical protein
LPDTVRKNATLTFAEEQKTSGAQSARWLPFDMSARRQYFVARKLARCISRCKGLRNHENCGLAATRAFENSLIHVLNLPSLSTSPPKLFSVLKFELIRTRERKREGIHMAKTAMKTKAKVAAKKKPMKRAVAKKSAKRR